MANKLLTVARAGYMHRAYFLKNWLETAGIESVIFNQGAGAQMGDEIELQVDEKDVPRALEIVENVRMKYEPRSREIKQKLISVKNILVPIDFTRHSLNGAKYAIQVAKQKNASITLVHAHHDPAINPVTYENFYSYPADLTETHREIERDAEEKMIEFIYDLKQYMYVEGISDIKPRRRILAGSPGDVILSLSESGLFDLIIVGSRELVPSDSWFGTFTSDIIERSAIPVLAIPEEAVYKKSEFKRLMYATNFDKSDGIAIRKLLNIASPLHTQVHVVHIDNTNDNPYINFDLSHFKEKYIGEIGDVDMIFNLIVNENILEGIGNYIAENDIDILAVTTHKRNVITSLLRPSITKELLFKVNVPMLVFHSNP